MRIDGLGRSLAFGAVASISLVFVENLLAALRLAMPILPIYLLGCLVGYAGLLGSSRRSSVRNGCVATFAGCLVLLIADSTPGIAVGLTLVLALVRSGLDPQRRSVRMLACESLLAVLALAVAFWAGGPGWIEQAAGLWGYVLAQSLFFLLPVNRASWTGSGRGDVFDRARAAISSLLEET